MAVKNARINGAAPSAWTTQIDVANGYPSQSPFIRGTQQSKFIESAYAQDIPNKHAAARTLKGGVGWARENTHTESNGKGAGN